MRTLRLLLAAAATIGFAATCRGADQGHHRKGDRRRRFPRSDLRRAGRGLLQSRRPGCQARRIAGQRPGHRRSVRQSRLRADPLGRRPSGAERRQDHVHRRQIAEIAVDHHDAPGHQQAGGPQGQDAGLSAAPAAPTTTRRRRCCTASFTWMPARITRSSRSRASPSASPPWSTTISRAPRFRSRTPPWPSRPD